MFYLLVERERGKLVADVADWTEPALAEIPDLEFGADIMDAVLSVLRQRRFSQAGVARTMSSRVGIELRSCRQVHCSALTCSRRRDVCDSQPSFRQADCARVDIHANPVAITGLDYRR
jgi:hypothetical protein